MRTADAAGIGNRANRRRQRLDYARSEYWRYLGDKEGLKPELGQPAPYVGRHPPTTDPDAFLDLYQQFDKAAKEGLFRSAATPTKGGIAVSLAKCCLAGDLGAEIDLDAAPDLAGLDTDISLFSESNGRFIVTIAAADASRIETLFADHSCHSIGRVNRETRLLVSRRGDFVIDLSIDSLRDHFKRGLQNV